MSFVPEGVTNETAPDHATGVIRPSATTFALALAISLAAYPTGKIQSSDKSEHSKISTLVLDYVLAEGFAGVMNRPV